MAHLFSPQKTQVIEPRYIVDGLPLTMNGGTTEEPFPLAKFTKEPLSSISPAVSKYELGALFITARSVALSGWFMLVSLLPNGICFVITGSLGIDVGGTIRLPVMLYEGTVELLLLDEKCRFDISVLMELMLELNANMVNISAIARTSTAAEST
jgi:hypothetical protein